MSKHTTNDESDEDELHLSLLPVMTDSSKAVSAPGENDVICGRGKSVMHPGNQRFRRMVAARKEEYKQAKRRDDKTRIAFEVVEALRQDPEPSRYVCIFSRIASILHQSCLHCLLFVHALDFS
jgi:hypothetical protein